MGYPISETHRAQERVAVHSQDERPPAVEVAEVCGGGRRERVGADEGLGRLLEGFFLRQLSRRATRYPPLFDNRHSEDDGQRHIEKGRQEC